MPRELLNTLYITHPNAYARLDGDTIRVEADGERLLQVPLLKLDAIVLFDRATLSNQLMHRCAEDGRAITFLDYSGRFKCRLEGPISGNVLLRKAQYTAQSDPQRTLEIARSIIAGKIKNTRQTLLRAAREAREPLTTAALQVQADLLATYLLTLPDITNLDTLRGIEGQAANAYFTVFGEMIHRDKADFAFANRTRRPPRDRVNALMSFLYSILTNDCRTACESVGLDPQFGFLHVLRPGRPALALDLMEEFRSFFADRLLLTLLNRRQIHPHHFDERPGESYLLTAEGRKIVITAYQTRKQEEITHPILEQKMPLGLLPQIQARLLARHLRGDMDCYLPYIAR